MNNMTMSEAIAYQNRDLQRWETVLRPEIAFRMKQAAIKSNQQTDNPYEIMRGTNFDQWIADTMTDLSK